jgi:hypothetical protein
MKQRIHLVALSLFFPFWAGAQNINDNPVAYKYLLKHFGLMGKVKSVTTYGANNNLMTDELFDTEGRMTATVSYTGMTAKSNFTYETPKKLIKVAQQTGSLPPVNYLYQYNSNREVEFSLYKEGDPLRKFEYRGNMLIKDSSANRYSTQKAYYSYYEYNPKGQLFKLRDFNGDGKLSREAVYSYEGNVTTVKGKTNSYNGTDFYEKKYYYDAKGSLVKSTYTANGKTETTEYKLDASGNWVWKTGGITRKIAYHDAPPAAGKETGKTDNNAKLSLLFGENFDNNNNQWAIWDNEGSSAKIVNGNYRFTVKQSNNYSSWFSIPGLAADQSKDFSIETKMFLSNTETGNAFDSYWLLWGIGNAGKSFYAFGVYPEGKFQYGKNMDGNWDGKAGKIYSSAINAGINKANILKVEKRKGNLLFFINGIEVYRTTYETFNSNHAGVGFQLNNKKSVDIDYLKVFQGTESSMVLSPQPFESDYQKALANAANSGERANAIIDYYLAVKQSGYSAEQLENLLGQKFLQMMDIDYHGFTEVLMSKRIKFDDVKLCVKASEVLTSEQRAGIKTLAQYTVDEFVAKQNNKPAPAYPAGIPRPGYGWGKTVSSNKTTYSNNGNSNPPAVVTPPPFDELAALKSSAYNLQGATVFLGNTNYQVPGKINITRVDDEITLVGIGAKYSYSAYYSKSVFGTGLLNNVTKTIRFKDLIRMIDNVSGAYIVTEIGPCGSCSGQGSSWDNRSRTRTYCTSCNGTGCVPTYIWNNGSSRRY